MENGADWRNCMRSPFPSEIVTRKQKTQIEDNKNHKYMTKWSIISGMWKI